MENEDEFSFKLGGLNGHVLGEVMKTAANRAIAETLRQRFTFEAQSKGEKESGGEDFVTTADRAAQAIVIRKLTECVEGVGIQAEEEGSEGLPLSIPCTIEGCDAFFTVDPIDGTSAFKRMQSHGFGPMLALVVHGWVVAACVGDAMTEELFYFRPGSRKVHHLTRGVPSRRLDLIDRSLPLSECYVQLRDGPEEYSPLVQRLVRSRKHVSGYFKGIQTVNGGIGLGMSKLWTGEVGMAILRPGKQKAHDWMPVIGLSTKLGFAFIRIAVDPTRSANPNGVIYQQFRPMGMREDQLEEFEVVVVHESHVEEFRRWFHENTAG